GMACGCFPVVTDIPANRAWIQDGENGFLVPTDDPKFLADRISSAINSKALMEGARKKNSEQVKQRAAWEEIMRNIEKKYRSLISSTLD
ncbi:MAG: glycosyltransferase, partial [Candidatus Latescibacteria bacterium]|nr:glycosyltransferase [Candidatus Latescibacterota bacterium]